MVQSGFSQAHMRSQTHRYARAAFQHAALGEFDRARDAFIRCDMAMHEAPGLTAREFSAPFAPFFDEQGKKASAKVAETLDAEKPDPRITFHNLPHFMSVRHFSFVGITAEMQRPSSLLVQHGILLDDTDRANGTLGGDLHDALHGGGNNGGIPFAKETRSADIAARILGERDIDFDEARILRVTDPILFTDPDYGRPLLHAIMGYHAASDPVAKAQREKAIRDMLDRYAANKDFDAATLRMVNAITDRALGDVRGAAIAAFVNAADVTGSVMPRTHRRSSRLLHDEFMNFDVRTKDGKPMAIVEGPRHLPTVGCARWFLSNIAFADQPNPIDSLRDLWGKGPQNLVRYYAPVEAYTAPVMPMQRNPQFVPGTATLQ